MVGYYDCDRLSPYLENVCLSFKIYFYMYCFERHCLSVSMYIQSTLVISNLKGPSETLRDIRTSTYKIFRIEENTNRTTKFNK